MHSEEMIFGVNDKDMQRFIEYIKQALDADDGDEIIVVNNFWHLSISKIPQFESSSV